MAAGRFEGKTALVSGGGRGIGEATARLLAIEGGDVLVVARTGAEVDAVAASIGEAGGRSWSLVADVSEPDSVDRVVDAACARWPRIDVLVNCAGIDHDSPFLDFPVEEWHRVLAVNLTGAFLMAQRVARVMAATGGGAIVHVSSIDAYGAD